MILVLSSVCCLLSSLPARAEVIDRVLAVVAGDVITLSDVNGALQLGLIPSSGAGDPLASALNRLIDRQLMLGEVRRFLPPEPDPELIQRRLDTLGRRFPSEAAFAEALAAAGLDQGRLQEIVRDDLRIAAYLEERFAGAAEDQRQALVSDWVAGLRRRTEITELYLAR